MKKKHEMKYFEERLYCDNCGIDISDLINDRNNPNITTATLYKTERWIDKGLTQTIIGKKYTCKQCGYETIEDKYNVYPILHKQIVE